MKCFNHPANDAVGVCAQCGRFGCTACLTDVGNALLCTSCHGNAQRQLAYEQAEIAAQAKRTLTWSWIVTVVLSLVLIIAALGNGASIILAPLIIYAAWSFYWGIGPVWRGFSHFFGGWGCFGTWFVVLFVAIVLCEILAIIAVAYGALGGGISRYRQTKELAGAA